MNKTITERKNVIVVVTVVVLLSGALLIMIILRNKEDEKSDSEHKEISPESADDAPRSVTSLDNGVDSLQVLEEVGTKASDETRNVQPPVLESNSLPEVAASTLPSSTQQVFVSKSPVQASTNVPSSAPVTGEPAEVIQLKPLPNPSSNVANPLPNSEPKSPQNQPLAQTSNPPSNLPPNAVSSPLPNPPLNPVPNQVSDLPPPKSTSEGPKAPVTTLPSDPINNHMVLKPLTIIEDCFKKVADPKMAALLQKVFANPSAEPELEAYCQELSAADGKQSAFDFKCKAIFSFYDSAAKAYQEFIERARETENWEAAKMAVEYFPVIQKAQKVRSIVSLPPHADLSTFLCDCFLSSLNELLNNQAPDMMPLGILRKARAYYQSFEKFFSSFTAKGIAPINTGEYQKTFKDLAYSFLFRAYKRLMIQHLIKNEKAEYDKRMKEAKELITELSLSVPSPEMVLDEIPKTFENECKVYDGPVVIASNPPRPVNNNAGLHCFAISVLQALACFYPTIASSVTVNMSIKCEASSFVHIMQALLANDKGMYDIFKNHKLAAYDDGGGDAIQFFDSLLTCLAKSDGLHFSDLFRMAESMNGVDIWPASSLGMYCPQCHVNHSGSRACPKGNDNPLTNFNMGAVAAISNRPTSDDPGYREIFPQISLPVAYTMQQRKYALGAMVCSVGGHTIAFVKRQNGQWYLVDDSAIIPIRFDQLPLKPESQSQPNLLNLPPIPDSSPYRSILPMLYFYYLVKP